MPCSYTQSQAKQI